MNTAGNKPKPETNMIEDPPAEKTPAVYRSTGKYAEHELVVKLIQHKCDLTDALPESNLYLLCKHTLNTFQNNNLFFLTVLAPIRELTFSLNRNFYLLKFNKYLEK